MSTVYYVGTSLDGFIATPDHSLDWLTGRHIEEDGPQGYPAFEAGVGAIVMGAATYEWVHAAVTGAGEGWMYDVPAWVLTHRELAPIAGDIRFASADSDDEVRALHAAAVAAAGGKNVWIVGGGELVGRFADVGLVDELVLAYAPCVLGAGAPLLPRALDLELLEVDRNGDFVVVRYAVAR